MRLKNIPLRKLVKTTSFKLTLIFMIMFVLFAGVLISFLAWNSRQAFEAEVLQNIRSESIGLAEAYRAGRLPFLVRAANGRGARPDAPIILVVDRNGNKLAGNISNIDPKYLISSDVIVMPYRRTIVELSQPNRLRPNNNRQRPLLPRQQSNIGQEEIDLSFDDEDEKDSLQDKDSEDKAIPLLSLRVRVRPNSEEAQSEKKEQETDIEELEIQDRTALVQVFRVRNGVRVLIGRDLGSRSIFLDVLEQAAYLTAGMALIMGLVGGLFISRRVLSRVEGVTATANQIMKGDLSERMMISGSGDEFDRLASSLNEMLDRLELLMRGMKEVSDNIAHDLKTPLTRMRTRIETALRSGKGEGDKVEALEVAVEDADQLISTFNALLHIARLEAGNTALKSSELDISTIAADVVELYEPSAEEANLPLKINIASGLKAMGNRELIAQAMSNILDNAIKYGSATDQGQIGGIHIDVNANNDNIEISIADNGIGIPGEEYNRVLERFVRLEKSRTSPGNGLGLSLVRAIMSHHKGNVILSDNNPGLKVTLVLPGIMR